jgi:hypothetical protein
MFAKTIVLSDDFLDMPTSTRCLYFTLGMFADDDGFVNSPKSIIRQIGASVDDMNILIGKKFVLAFEDGVIVIKHWRIHNYIQNDRKKDTKYLEHRGTLYLEENKAYTQNKNKAKYNLDGTLIANVYKMDTQVRIGKDSLELGKVSEGESKEPTPFDTFISKYSINVDNYSGRLAEMDFNLLDKAFSESNWLCENYVSLSRICKDYEKIVGGYYKDFSAPAKKHFENERQHSQEDYSSMLEHFNNFEV